MTRDKQINWGPSIFLIAYQAILLITLPFYFYYAQVQWSTVALSAVLLYATGMSITGGYHRYFSHKAFKTNPFVETILLFFGTMTAQGSALRWSYDHRIHHAYVDTDNDPYSIKKGFWYAHFLWILEKPRKIDPKVVSDLLKNPRVAFQHKYYPYLMVASNALVFFLAGWALNDYLGAFVLVCWTRLFVLHHFTWFINSLAHTWGDKPFSQEQTAVDNYFISFLTFGEGYHNYHHTFANDYRNGIRWFHFDPTKWLIWSLSKLGLAHSLKKMDAATIQKRMVVEHKSVLIAHLSTLWTDKKQEMEKQVQELSDKLLEELNAFSKLTEEYANRKMKETAHALEDMRLQIEELKIKIHNDWKMWKRLSKAILVHS